MGSQHAAADGPFAGALDLDRVGVFGHSNGGGAAIQFAGTDARCRAVFGEDPFLRSVCLDVLARGVANPSFFMFSQEWADEPGSRNNELLGAFLSRTPCSLGVVSVRGTRHYDLSDLPLVSPLARVLGLKGPINGRRVVSIVNGYLLGFFDMTLKGTRATLLDDAGRYPEVEQVKGYELTSTLGNMFENTIALARIIASGLLDKHPKLKLVCPHLGGTLPYICGRMDHKLYVLKRGPQNLKRKPSEYLRSIHMDIVSPLPEAMRFALDFSGPDKLLYSSDHPWVQPTEILDPLRSLKLASAAEAKILRGNAQTLFRL